MLYWPIFHSWIFHGQNCARTSNVVRFFIRKICWLVLICTNFRAQNHRLVLIAPHGLVYFFKKFQTWIKNWQRACFDWLIISVLVWTSHLLQHKIKVRLDLLFPLQLFSLAMVNSDSPCLSWSVNLLVLSCHVLFTATVLLHQDGTLK